MICTFFGHRDAPLCIEQKLKSVLGDLVKQQSIDMFYVGNQGEFDYIVKKVLKEMSLNYYIVLAYMPIKRNEMDMTDYADTIYPDGLEESHPRFAIDKRNKWMIEKSDIVITYVTHDFGGAARFKKLAKSKGKIIIELSEN